MEIKATHNPYKAGSQYGVFSSLYIFTMVVYWFDSDSKNFVVVYGRMVRCIFLRTENSTLIKKTKGMKIWFLVGDFTINNLDNTNLIVGNLRM